MTPNPTTPPRSLICMQYYEGDRLKAYETLRYYVDIQPARCETADIMMVRRRGTVTDKKTEAIIKHVSRKFNVSLIETDRHETGWPAGCNGMVFSIFNHVLNIQRGTGVKYDNFVLLESDAYPLVPGWIVQLQAAWSKRSREVIMGDLVDECPHPTAGRHCNGNMMMTTDIKWLEKLVRIAGVPGGVGWDWALAPMFNLAGILDTPLIKSEWGSKTASKSHLDRLLKINVALLHGVKDDSVIQWGRAKYNLPTT